MTNKLKRLTKTGILLLFTTLLLWNCQQEEKPFVEEEHSNHTQMTLQKGIVPNISNNSTLQQKLQNLSNKTSLGSNTQSKNNNDNGALDFTININKANYITHGDYHSYTFPIIRFQDNGLLENLLLSYQSNGTYRAYIISYDLTEDEKNILLNTGRLPEGFHKINFKNLDDTALLNSLFSKGTGEKGCWEEITITPTCSYAGQHTAKEIKEGHSCRQIAEGGFVGDSYNVIVATECNDGSSGGPFNPIGNNPYDGGTGNGGPVTPKDGDSTDPSGGDCDDTLNTGFDNGNGGCVKDTTFPTANEVDEAIKGIMGCVSLSRDDIGFLQASPNLAINIRSLLNKNGCSDKINTYAKGQIELEKLHNDNKIKLKPLNGKINNRDDQKYTHFGTNGVFSFYKMEDGSMVISSPDELTLNSDGKLVREFTSETSNSHYWYIKPEGSITWSNYLIKTNHTNLAHELEITAKLALLELGKAIGTYVLPIEDIKILITGTDFDGAQVSRLQTAGFMFVGIIPGGKLLKPLSKGTGKVWKVVVKNGDKVFTRTVRELTEETIRHFDNYAEGASDLLQEALRKGDILDDEIVIEVGQEIADLSAKKGRKLTWSEVKALFKRGNDFNKKGRLKYGDDNVEIVLADGKRLDTYIDGQKIVSRKATDIDNITESTWRNYCNELVTKYKAGKWTNSRKLGDSSDQVQLRGKYHLEIPASNQNASSLERFKQIASEYGTENQPEGIIITFLTE